MISTEQQENLAREIIDAAFHVHKALELVLDGLIRRKRANLILIEAQGGSLAVAK